MMSSMTLMYGGYSLSGSRCRRPSLNHFMHSTSCSVILGISLLGTGAAITVLSLKSLSSANKIFLMGPILMTVGIIGLSRSLMQYMKSVDRKRRRQANRARRRARLEQRLEQRRQQQQTCAVVCAPRLPGCQRTAQREDSEAAIYVDPTDTDDGTYSDEPPPYDFVAPVGTTIASRIQMHSERSSSLPSLPPYDEGLCNPALDLSAEFPSPPPYEIVAVQPPSYSPAPTNEGQERPVLSTTQTIRQSGRKSIHHNPSRRTVRDIAHRLAQSLQSQDLSSPEGPRARSESPQLGNQSMQSRTESREVRSESPQLYECSTTPSSCHPPSHNSSHLKEEPRLPNESQLCMESPSVSDVADSIDTHLSTHSEQGESAMSDSTRSNPFLPSYSESQMNLVRSNSRHSSPIQSNNIRRSTRRRPNNRRDYHSDEDLTVCLSYSPPESPVPEICLDTDTPDSCVDYIHSPGCRACSHNYSTNTYNNNQLPQTDTDIFRRLYNSRPFPPSQLHNGNTHSDPECDKSPSITSQLSG